MTTPVAEKPEASLVVVNRDTGEILDERMDALSEAHAMPVVGPTLDVHIGVATQPVSEAQAAILLRPCDVADLDILPTGEVYLSQIGYRRRLNEAFRPGGWGMVPLGKPTSQGATLMQEWALYVGGRFISSAWGEADYHETNDRQSYATAAESLKSNALMRCCKDLGIASECWDRKFTEAFKAEHCIQVWRREAKGKPQWRRKDAPAFYDESGAVAPKSENGTAPKAQAGESLRLISDAQRKRMYAIGKDAKWTDDEMKDLLEKTYGLASSKDVPISLYDEICKVLASGIIPYEKVL